MQLPTRNKVSLKFGATTPPYSPSKPHIGVDFAYTPDDIVYMPESGIVQVVEWDGKTAEGNVIYITVSNRRHALCHLSKFLVKNGQYVERGTPVGVMGETGFAIGKHLHWALRVNGVLVDPLTQVNESFIGGNMPTLIDEKLADVLRMGHSEMGGWNYNEVHNGTHDSTFLKAWKGQPLEAFIREQWKNGEKFRNQRIKEMTEYPQLTVQVNDLQKKNAELQKQLDSMTNGDAIIITRSGWSGLFDYLKQFFNKKG